MKTKFNEEVEYLARLAAANASFESSIRKSIPQDIMIKDRAPPVALIAPHSSGYESARTSLIGRVSSPQAVAVLNFLYVFDKYLSNNFVLFYHQYHVVLSHDKMTQVKDNYPSLDQTTVSTILTGVFKETTIESRIEDLELVGLVWRSETRKPSPKKVGITQRGIGVIEEAIVAGRTNLAPLFMEVGYTEVSPSTACAVGDQTNG